MRCLLAKTEAQVADLQAQNTSLHTLIDKYEQVLRDKLGSMETSVEHLRAELRTQKETNLRLQNTIDMYRQNLH